MVEGPGASGRCSRAVQLARHGCPAGGGEGCASRDGCAHPAGSFSALSSSHRHVLMLSCRRGAVQPPPEVARDGGPTAQVSALSAQTSSNFNPSQGQFHARIGALELHAPAVRAAFAGSPCQQIPPSGAVSRFRIVTHCEPIPYIELRSLTEFARCESSAPSMSMIMRASSSIVLLLLLPVALARDEKPVG